MQFIVILSLAGNLGHIWPRDFLAGSSAWMYHVCVLGTDKKLVVTREKLEA
jgi:hypothetical protein